MNFNDTWRDRQLNNFEKLTANSVVLQQEQVMLNFVTKFPQARWRWIAPLTQFYHICQNQIQIVEDNYDAVILFGPAISNIGTATLVERILNFTAGVKYAYVAINRYLITSHTLNINLPESIEESIDCVIEQAHPEFRRLARFDNVDGNHMIFAHPMDCFGLCK